MKKILLITGLFFLSIMQLNGQDWNSKRDSIRYAVAYEYILKDSVMIDEAIILSGEIMHTQFYFFHQQLESYIRRGNENNFEYWTRLSNVDKGSLDPNSITKFKYPVEKKKGKIVGVLSFSNIFDTFLFARVYFTGSVPPFGTSYEYCFIFDLDNTIKEVIRLETQGL